MLALMVAYDLYGRPLHISYVIDVFSQQNLNIKRVITSSDLRTYYEELFPNFDELVPEWLVSKKSVDDVTRPQALQDGSRGVNNFY